MAYKDTKPLIVIRQFEVIQGQTDYDITGLELAKLKLFYRKEGRIFLPLYEADYLIVIEDSRQILRITNADLLAVMLEIQTNNEIIDISMEYNPIGDASIEELTDLFNNLVESFKDTRQYTVDHLMIGDSIFQTRVLPILKNNEIWVYNEPTDEFRAVEVPNVDSLLDEIKAACDECIDKIIKEGDDQIDRIKDQSMNIDYIYRMFMMISGAWRVFSGNDLYNRTETALGECLMGNDLAERGNLILKRCVNGRELLGRVDLPCSCPQ